MTFSKENDVVNVLRNKPLLFETKGGHVNSLVCCVCMVSFF